MIGLKPANAGVVGLVKGRKHLLFVVQTRLQLRSLHNACLHAIVLTIFITFRLFFSPGISPANVAASDVATTGCGFACVFAGREHHRPYAGCLGGGRGHPGLFSHFVSHLHGGIAGRSGSSDGLADGYVFRCDVASLIEGVSVLCRSVYPYVTRFQQAALRRGDNRCW